MSFRLLALDFYSEALVDGNGSCTAEASTTFSMTCVVNSEAYHDLQRVATILPGTMSLMLHHHFYAVISDTTVEDLQTVGYILLVYNSFYSSNTEVSQTDTVTSQVHPRSIHGSKILSAVSPHDAPSNFGDALKDFPERWLRNFGGLLTAFFVKDSSRFLLSVCCI